MQRRPLWHELLAAGATRAHDTYVTSGRDLCACAWDLLGLKTPVSAVQVRLLGHPLRSRVLEGASLDGDPVSKMSPRPGWSREDSGPLPRTAVAPQPVVPRWFVARSRAPSMS
ncbi:MAG: hypothetical protein MZV64_36300 [Ignavibacteriales bacterium]|nr:hypothetical protein [Ignavibacteriales bacterium]